MFIKDNLTNLLAVIGRNL